MEKNLINKKDKTFIKIADGKVKILFSTADNEISYKIATKEGEDNLKDLKEIFFVDEVNYTNQIHSSVIFDLDNVEEVKKKQGDGLISTEKNKIIGVFTADCVPVILYDKEKEVIAAVHSGWKGTIGDIAKEAALTMKNKYGAKDIKVIIGPHIKNCCYEVSEELAEKFKEKYGEEVIKGRMLNLEEAIRKQLKEIVASENISSLDICTNCNQEYKMHSYRKKGEEAGRLFSFIYIK